MDTPQRDLDARYVPEAETGAGAHVEAD